LASRKWRLLWRLRAVSAPSVEPGPPSRWTTITGQIPSATLFAWLVSWWSGPLTGAGLNRFTPGIFDLRGIVPVFYAAFAFALGGAVGTLLRRTVAAMGVTLLGYAGVRAAVTFLGRPHFATPVVISSPLAQGSPRPDLADWVLQTQAVDRLGHTVGRGGGIDLKLLSGGCPLPTTFANPRASMESCLQQLGVIESAIFAALTVVLVALTVRWIRRRIA
jgi:hypothetical protein